MLPYPKLAEIRDRLCRPASPFTDLTAVLLLADDLQARSKLAMARAADAELLASARASIAADRDGEPDPLAPIRMLLTERGQLPPDNMRPAQLLTIPHGGGHRAVAADPNLGDGAR
jgi:hypothetical protein